MPKEDYDHRRRAKARLQEDEPPPSNRERSRSPVQDAKARRQAERRAEMERLRAENEEEERRLAAWDRRAEVEETTPTVQPQEQIVQVNPEELQGLDEEEQMRKLLGIEGFGTTKGQKVESNHNSSASGAANKNKARKYRQYMNRKGGFNRPLDKMN